MSDSGPPTGIQRPERMIVVIGGPDALVHAARRVAALHTDAGVSTATVADAANKAAEHRPLALVLSTDLYALDPAEFQALARDVGAEVIVVETDGLSPQKIADALTPSIVKAAEA